MAAACTAAMALAKAATEAVVPSVTTAAAAIDAAARELESVEKRLRRLAAIPPSMKSSTAT